MPKWLRWLLLLPASLLAVALAVAIYSLILSMYPSTDTIVQMVGYAVIDGIIAACLALATAYFMAPSHKKGATVGIAIILNALSIVAITLTCTQDTGIPLMELICAAVFGLLSSILICTKIVKRNDEPSFAQDGNNDDLI